MKTITVLCGLPAAGKSTWAKRNARGALVVSADDLKRGNIAARALFGRMFRDAGFALSRGQSVVIDACSLRSFDRKPWITMARRHGARAELVIINTPPDVCEARNAARAKPVPRFDLHRNRWRRLRLGLAGERWDRVKQARGGS